MLYSWCFWRRGKERRKKTTLKKSTIINEKWILDTIIDRKKFLTVYKFSVDHSTLFLQWGCIKVVCGRKSQNRMITSLFVCGAIQTKAMFFLLCQRRVNIILFHSTEKNNRQNDQARDWPDIWSFPPCPVPSWQGMGAKLYFDLSHHWNSFIMCAEAQLFIKKILKQRVQRYLCTDEVYTYSLIAYCFSLISCYFCY